MISFNKKSYISLLDEKVPGCIFLLSVPLIFGNILQQIYYITDSIIIGKYIDINALAAVNSCSWLTWGLNALGRDFSTAYSIVESTYVGQKNKQYILKAIANGLIISILLGVFLVIAIELLIDPIMALFSVQPNVLSITKNYYMLVMIGIPFVLLFNISAGILRALGNSQISFIAITISTITNITFDIFFVVVLHGGVAGAALATVIAQIIAAWIVLVEIKKSGYFKMPKEYWKPEISIQQQVLNIYIPLCINSVAIVAGGIFVSSHVNKIGSFMTAGISAGERIFSLIEAAIIAIQSALSVFIGQNYGAGHYRRVMDGIKKTVLIGFLLSIGINILIQPCVFQVTSIFLSRSDIDAFLKTSTVAQGYLRTMTAFLVVMIPMYFYRIAIQSIGHAKWAMIAGLGQLATRIIVTLALPPYLGYYAYYLTTPIAWCVSFPIVTIPLFKIMKNKK